MDLRLQRGSQLTLPEQSRRQEIVDRGTGAVLIMGFRGLMLSAKFALSLFVAKFIGLDALGIYGLVAAAVAVGQIVMRFGLFATISRNAVGQSAGQLLPELIRYGFACSVAYCFVAIAVGYLGYLAGTLTLALLTVGIVLVEHASYDMFVLMNCRHKPLLANMILSVQSSVWPYAFIMASFLLPELRTITALLCFWLFGGCLAVMYAVLLTRHWPWVKSLTSWVEPGWYFRGLRSSWQLFAGEVAGTAARYIDRYLITTFLSLEMAGVYLLYWQVTNAINNLIGAGVLQVFRPRLILSFRRDARAFYHTLRQCVATGVIANLLLASGSAVAIPFLVKLLDSPQATQFLPLFWLMLSVNVIFTVYDCFMLAAYARNRDGLSLAINLYALVFILTGGAASIYMFGVWGAPINSALIYATSAFLVGILISRQRAQTTRLSEPDGSPDIRRTSVHYQG